MPYGKEEHDKRESEQLDALALNLNTLTKRLDPKTMEHVLGLVEAVRARRIDSVMFALIVQIGESLETTGAFIVVDEWLKHQPIALAATNTANRPRVQPATHGRTPNIL
jgi:hypothetical protein